MHQPIGGYFSLELPIHEEYHKDAIRLNTGRNCLEYILRARKYSKVYIPYYTCDVILEPFHKLDVNYEFYHINLDFEIVDDIQLSAGEALLYTNYYGLKHRYVEYLAEQYGQQLIVDNTQGFYDKPINGIDTFYTCRKFFGVPDGAYLYIDKLLDGELEQDESYERMSFLLKRIDLGAEAGYADFREQSRLLVGQPIKRMSKLTERLMQSIDYEDVANCRRKNFLFLHRVLQKSNRLQFSLEDDVVPMIYPYLTIQEDFRDYLIKNKVFVAKYWPNVLNWSTPNSYDYILAEGIMPLPTDQRYSSSQMNSIYTIIKNYVKR